MKLSKYILLLALACTMPSCMDLDIPPMNVVQDKDVFGSENGIKSYLARVYGQIPMEDFRYSPERGLNMFWIIMPAPAYTGEALCRDVHGALSENTKYWGDAYRLIRDINYFLETLPQYEVNFTEDQMNTWKGEMLFARGFTYYALAKRYGGVPLVNEVLKYPEQPIEEMKVPRSSEAATFDQVKADLDEAYNLLPESNQVGRATKYAAAALKSRAMLHAGSIAKYNAITMFDDSNNRLCGIDADKATAYFKEAYDAAKLLEGHFSLYKNAWKADDKEAQYQNYVDLFFDENSKENILVREYQYPNSVHGYDCYNIPRQYMVGGYSSYVCPTLDYVEMFEGFPKENGKVKTTENGKYQLYDNLTDFFKDAEPRLRATVMLPGDEFKGESFESWRGIYVGPTAGGISPLLAEGAVEKYEAASCKDNVVTSSNAGQTAYQLSNGEMMNPAGRSGRFADDAACAISGFSVRKWMNPDMDAALVVENRSEQSWIELRYAEVLLNRAEAAIELAAAGQGANYQADAAQCINEIRERAGATQLDDAAALTIDDVRLERRKELGFENKTWWDLKRWRLMDKEQNNTIYRILMPFYADKENKWFFDARYDERAERYTFDTKWYYVEIPGDEVVKNNIKQNPGY